MNRDYNGDIFWHFRDRHANVTILTRLHASFTILMGNKHHGVEVTMVAKQNHEEQSQPSHWALFIPGNLELTSDWLVSTLTVL